MLAGWYYFMKMVFPRDPLSVKSLRSSPQRPPQPLTESFLMPPLRSLLPDDSYRWFYIVPDMMPDDPR